MPDAPSYVKATEKQLGFRPDCPCGGWAVVSLQAHPVDACGGRTAPADVLLLCRGCLERELASIQRVLLDAFLGLRPAECNQCGLTIVTLSDIIVRLQPLWIWSD